MANIRFICWNIFNFAAGTSGILNRTDSTERVLEVIHPAAGAAACDIFIMIEPVTKKGKVGQAAVGGGPTGGASILGMLQARVTGGADWRMAPPLIIYSSTKGETVLVFYQVSAVDVHGVPALLSNVPGAAKPNWRILNARESCPYHLTFRIAGTVTDFDLIAQHAPSPTYGTGVNDKANRGVAAVAAHATVIGSARAVYLGDLNLCGVATPTLAPACANSDTNGHSADRATLAAFTTGPAAMTLVAGRERSSLKKDAAVWDVYREHAYDNILAKGHTAVANAGVIDLIAPLITQYQVTSPGAIPANVFRSNTIFHKVRLASKRGISDHLPIRVTLTF